MIQRDPAETKAQAEQSGYEEGAPQQAVAAMTASGSAPDPHARFFCPRHCFPWILQLYSAFTARNPTASISAPT